MKVLFTAAAQRPHFYPLVTLAWAFRAAGHDVRVAAQPPVVPEVLRSGLPAVAVGGSYDYVGGMRDIVKEMGSRGVAGSRRDVKAVSEKGVGTLVAPTDIPPDELRRLRGLRYVPHVETARAMAADLVPFIQSWQPDLVVTDPLVFVAPMVADIAGVPLVRHLFGPDALRRLGYPAQGREVDGPVRDSWPQGLVELFDQYGAEVRVNYAARTVDPWPGSIQLDGVPNRLPVRTVPYNGATVVPEWLAKPADRPRVCVTWGTSATAIAGADGFVVPRIVAALQPLDVEIVLALDTADLGRLGDDLPPNVRLADRLPLDLLLPGCAAIVNPAGAGTMLTAAVHGVPQLLIPQIAEAPMNAKLFADSGAAIALDTDTMTDEELRSAVTEVTFGATREAAARLRAEIEAQPSPADIIPELSDLRPVRE